MRPDLRLLSLALLVLAAMGQAMMVQLPQSALDANAELIVSGTVTGTESRWNNDNSSIYTYVTLAVDKVDKGTADQAVTVRVPGGEVGDVGMAVEDMPVFQIGDRVTLWLVSREGNLELLDGMQSVTQPTDARPLVYYSYSGYHRDPASCNYYTYSGLPSGWAGAIQAGGVTWSTAGSAFRFDYLGTTSASGTVYDGQNVVSRGSLSNGILAQNTYWYNRATKHVVENDIVFNTLYQWSTSGAPGYYDVQNIGTHEMGHCLVLNDLYKSYHSELTMYGYGATGETKKQTLEAGDIQGIKVIYGTGLLRTNLRPTAVD